MNGWKNYQTWTISLWGFGELDAEDPAVAEILADTGKSQDDKALQLSDFIREAFLDYIAETYPRLNGSAVGDLLASALYDVDWLELAKVWLDDNDAAQRQ